MLIVGPYVDVLQRLFEINNCLHRMLDSLLEIVDVFQRGMKALIQDPAHFRKPTHRWIFRRCHDAVYANVSGLLLTTLW